MAPAVHDIFSLRLVEQAGYQSACISGAMLSCSLLGVPDIGLLTLTECVEHCRRLTRVSSIPITADADAGYGNPRGVHYAVELFEEAGAAGLNIEDQVVPRRWASPGGKEVVPVGEMIAKIDAAQRARRRQQLHDHRPHGRVCMRVHRAGHSTGPGLSRRRAPICCCPSRRGPRTTSLAWCAR
ncbi:isocitrate lyase/PEP mutase family protein [Cupriavidus basilensis]